MAEKIETFEEIEVRVRNQLRNQAVPMKCSNCDFEVADKDVYYNHIVDNHVIEDPDTHREERSKIEDEHKNDIINEETLTEPFVYPPVELTKQLDMAGNEDDDTIVERTVDYILSLVVDMADQRKEWAEKLRKSLSNKNPNLLFSTLGSSQEPSDHESESGEYEESSDNEESNEEEIRRKEVLEEQERYLLENIVQDLVELESLEIDLVGGNAGVKIKQEMNNTELESGKKNQTDFQDQYQIFAENLFNPMAEKEMKKIAKRKQLKAMNKRKKKRRRMAKELSDDEADLEGDEEEGEEDNTELSATSSQNLRRLLASPNSMGR